MKDVLLITEKPSVSRAISQVIGSSFGDFNITYKPLHGHITCLYEPEKYKDSWKSWDINELPMIPSNFKYEITDKKLFKEIKELIKTNKFDFIVNATDAGREGEAIFWNVYDLLNIKIPVKRLWLKDITDTSIKEAMANLLDYTNQDLENLKESALIRQEIDWLYGMNYSRFYSISSYTGMAMGRVMTPVLKLIFNRDEEIKNFKSKKSYYLEVLSKSDMTYKSENYEDKLDVEKMKAEVDKDKFLICKEFQKNFEYTNPPLLPDLTDLQKEANKMFKFSSKKTLDILQGLYEKGLVSYPRTDSRYLTKAVADTLKDTFIKLKSYKDTGAEWERTNQLALLSNFDIPKRFINEGKVTDHHAIIPTGKTSSNLNSNEKLLYEYILKRFFVIFLKPIKKEVYRIIGEKNKKEYKANKSLVIERGYGEILLGLKEDREVIKEIKVGEEIPIKSSKIKESITRPPSHYTEASLLMVMQNPTLSMVEDLDQYKDILKEVGGIGTPATRAGIIEKLKKKKYISIKNNYIYISDLGQEIILTSLNHKIQDISLTGSLESKLKEIESGELDPSVFRKEIVENMSEDINSLQESTEKRVMNRSGAVIGTCPKCGGHVVNAKKFYKCENYKSDSGIMCDFTLPGTLCHTDIEVEDVERLLNGEETEEKEFTWKSGKTGSAKLRLDDEGKLVFIFPENKKLPKEEVGTCPKCGRKVIEGKNYYLCEGYKDSCDFIFGKTLCHSPITKADIKTLLSGGTTDEKEFTWKSGKKGNAKLKLKDDGNLEFIFED